MLDPHLSGPDLFSSEEISIDRVKRDYPSMSDFHMHTYFELSFILSGRVKVLFSDRAYATETGCLVLTRPYSLHYIIPEPYSGYERINILFTRDCLAGTLPEYESLLSSFGQQGSFIPLNGQDCESLLSLCTLMVDESSLLRKKMLLLLILSKICDLPGHDQSMPTPPYINEVLQHIHAHYPEKLIACDLAERFHVSRTKLMCDFHRFTGYTLASYITSVRLRCAEKLIQRGGLSLSQVAEASGLSSSSNLIRVFKREQRQIHPAL